MLHQWEKPKTMQSENAVMPAVMVMRIELTAQELLR